jgi:hypothetical protein
MLNSVFEAVVLIWGRESHRKYSAGSCTLESTVFFIRNTQMESKKCSSIKTAESLHKTLNVSVNWDSFVTEVNGYELDDQGLIPSRDFSLSPFPYWPLVPYSLQSSGYQGQSTHIC